MERPELLEINPAMVGIPKTLAAVHKLMFAERKEVRLGKLTKGHFLVETRLRELVLAISDETTPTAHFEALAKTTFACANVFRTLSIEGANPGDRLVAECMGSRLAEIAVCMAPEGSVLQRKLEARFKRDFV